MFRPDMFCPHAPTGVSTPTGVHDTPIATHALAAFNHEMQNA